MDRRRGPKAVKAELLPPVERGLTAAGYVYSDGEKVKLEELVGMLTDLEKVKKFPTWKIRAFRLGIPVERLNIWRTTPEYAALLQGAAHRLALEGVVESLPAQVKLAKSPAFEGSSKAFDSLIKVARLEPKALADSTGRGVVINIEQALIQQGRERLGLPAHKEGK